MNESSNTPADGQENADVKKSARTRKTTTSSAKAAPAKKAATPKAASGKVAAKSKADAAPASATDEAQPAKAAKAAKSSKISATKAKAGGTAPETAASSVPGDSAEKPAAPAKSAAKAATPKKAATAKSAVKPATKAAVAKGKSAGKKEQPETPAGPAPAEMKDAADSGTAKKPAARKSSPRTAARKPAATPTPVETMEPVAAKVPASESSAPVDTKAENVPAKKPRAARSAGKSGSSAVKTSGAETVADRPATEVPSEVLATSASASPETATARSRASRPESDRVTAPERPEAAGADNGETVREQGVSVPSGDAPAAEGEQGEAPSRSRRSRGRRGRRKSAAAKAAAQEAARNAANGSDALSGNSAETASARSDAENGDSGDSASGNGQDRPEAAEAGQEPREGSSRSRSRGRRGRKSGQKKQVENGAELVSDDSVSESGADSLDEAAEISTAEETEASDKRGRGRGGKKAQPEPKSESKSEAKAAKSSSRARRKMFVSVLPGEQVEVVITEEGQVQEYYVDMLHQVKVKGNIYKGVIHNVDPNLQAAFVSYGAVKNGFLQIDEVHPEYYLAPHEVTKGHKYPLIQKVLKAGQEILVQVVKEPAGTKGAFLTSYLSLPGRYIVLTPGREQIGVSRKVESEEERARLREMLSGLNPGEGLGVIVRTVSRGATKTSLQKDLQQLKRVWKEVRKKGSSEPAPSLIYQELGLDTRAVRDYLTEEVSELWVDDEVMAGQIKEIVAMLFPRRENMVQLHKDLDQSLFERFGLKKQLEQVHSREVTLPSGGRLVFDNTEALMAIDINSGRAAGKNNFEDTAFKTNLEAAQQIPLQLRLRDIGGQVVIDFIEMRDRSHWREVEKAIRNGMKVDRARHDVGKISSFGLLEIVRQRLSTSAISITSEPCPCCKGTGQRRNMEWQSMQALREIRAMMRKNSDSGSAVVYTGPEELVLYLLNNKKERLVQMEKEMNVKLDLRLSLDGAASCKCK